MGVDRARRADATVAEYREQPGDGGGELVGRQRGGTEERELGFARAIGVGAQGEGDDRRARRVGLEVEAHQGEQSLDVTGRGRQRDRALVVAVGLEIEGELEPLAAQARDLACAG